MAKTIVNNAKYKSNSKKAAERPLISTGGLKYFRRVLLVLLAGVVFYPPFLRGLYFEEEQLPTEIFVLLIFAAFWVYKALKRDKRLLETPLDYVSLGFTLVYMISIVVSVNMRFAVSEWLKYCMFFEVFIMISELAESYRSRIAIIWTIIASAIGISLLGIDGAAGAKAASVLNTFFKNVNILDSFFMIFSKNREAFFGLFVGGRINSTIQYPNALASFLLAVYFVSLGVMTASKSIWAKLVSGAASYILLITFILTLSRGVYILLPVAAVFYVLLLPKERRVRGVAYAFASLAGVGATVIKLSELMANNAGNESAIWKYVLIGTVFSTLAAFILHFIASWLEKFNWKVYAAIGAVLILGLIAGGITAFTLKEPLVLSHAGDQPDSIMSVRRSFYVEPEKEYKLVFDVEASGASENKSAYSIAIASRNFAGIINGIDTPITALEGKTTNGIEQKEIKFKAPSDARTVSITFMNQYQGTGAVFQNAKFVPLDNQAKEQSITLKYKIIPESFYSRIDDAKETKSGIERTIFYKDGFKAITDNGHWVLGAGGGSWPILYFAYQSYLYWTTQAHTYLVQIALECGLLGIAVLILLIAAIVSSLANEFKRRKAGDTENGIIQAALFTSIAAMLLHSFMDFDLSLSAVFLLLWVLLALLNARLKVQNEYPSEENKSAWSKLLDRVDIQNKVRRLGFHPAIGIIITLIIIILPITFLSGAISSDKAKRYYNSGDITNALKYMAKAADTDTLNYDYKTDFANLLIKQEQKSIKPNDYNKAVKYISQSEKAAEHNINLTGKTGAFYFAIGNIDKGLHFIEQAVKLRPMRPEEWQQKADTYMQLATLYLQKGDTNRAEEYFDKVMNIIDEVKEVNKRNLIPFTLNNPTQEIIERVKFIRDNVNGDKDLDLTKLVFYSVNEMDVNLDSVPDQWAISNREDVKLGIKNGNISAESAAAKTGYIYSRALKLKAGKSYKIEVTLAGASGVSYIPFAVSGVSDSNQGLKLTNGSYSAVVTTSSQFKQDNNALMLGISGNYEIKSVTIMEQ